jgi:CheY-like chemotaxis protein
MGTMQQAAAGREPAHPLVGGAKCRVLLIDDCPDMARLLRVYLADPNISLRVMSNAMDGIDAFKSGHFHLVLMDMQMPDMDGYEATRAIRTWEAEHRMPRTPIAALTAVSEFGASHRSLSAGCTLYLTKPIMRSTLLQIVHQYGSVK